MGRRVVRIISLSVTIAALITIASAANPPAWVTILYGLVGSVAIAAGMIAAFRAP